MAVRTDTPPIDSAAPAPPWLTQALPRLRGLEPTRSYGYAGELLHDDGRADMEAYGARVADLALRLGEALLSYGGSAEEAVAGMLVTAETYGLSYCEPGVTLASVQLSAYAPGELMPLHASRVIRKHATDFRTLGRIHRLVDRISARELDLDEARAETARVLDGPPARGGRWRVPVQTGFVAAGGSVVFGGGPLTSLCSFLAGLFGAALCGWLGRRGVPAFYRYAVASMPAGALALAVSGTAPPSAVQAIVVAGVLGLLPTVTFVSAIQDALTGHYLTALGRLCDALLVFAAVVTGVVVVLGLGDLAGSRCPSCRPRCAPTTSAPRPSAPLSSRSPWRHGPAPRDGTGRPPRGSGSPGSWSRSSSGRWGSRRSSARRWWPRWSAARAISWPGAAGSPRCRWSCPGSRRCCRAGRCTRR
ncbi:threonine/serine exporter family protein [Streptomyces sp. Q6]|uniref:Threonine/serine exporter family protein n=1 Tax=Streptomyces citrinus TaxID=3118173 RepID=A0ACD5ABS5_9ACTN